MESFIRFAATVAPVEPEHHLLTTFVQGLSRNTGETVAMKEISLRDWRGITPGEVMEEISALRTLGKHRGIVQLRDIVQTELKITLIFEYCTQDLWSFMNQYGSLGSATVRSLARQLLEGVKHCHQHGFYHRDLKPTNLLTHFVGGRWVLKIADFGHAKPTNSLADKTHYVSFLHFLEASTS